MSLLEEMVGREPRPLSATPTNYARDQEEEETFWLEKKTYPEAKKKRLPGRGEMKTSSWKTE